MEVRNGISAHFYLVCFKNFQRAFKRDRVKQTSAQHRSRRKIFVLFGYRSESVGHITENLRRFFRQSGQSLFQRRVAAPFRGECRHYVKLRRKGFCRRYARFRTCIAEERKVNRFCKGRAFIVCDGRRQRAVPLCVLDDEQHVLCHTGLRNSDDKMTGIVDIRSVS